jgi:3-deoxy-D-manno-octulosonic-acid transferase
MNRRNCAIKLGAAVISGPHWHNFCDSYEELLRADACVRVTDAKGLAEETLKLLDDALRREAMMARAHRAVAGMAGALPRTLAALERFLPPRATIQHAT